MYRHREIIKRFNMEPRYKYYGRNIEYGCYYLKQSNFVLEFLSEINLQDIAPNLEIFCPYILS